MWFLGGLAALVGAAIGGLIALYLPAARCVSAALAEIPADLRPLPQPFARMAVCVGRPVAWAARSLVWTKAVEWGTDDGGLGLFANTMIRRALRPGSGLSLVALDRFGRSPAQLTGEESLELLAADWDPPDASPALLESWRQRCLPWSGMPEGYRVSEVIALEGTQLELLEDERLVPSVREEWPPDEAMACHEPSGDSRVDSLCASIARRPLQPALLRLVGESQGVLDQRVFDRALAELEPIQLYGADRPVFAVTVDYSAGFGSYSGPATVFVEPSVGQFEWLVADDSATGQSSEMRVSRAGKRDWQTIERPGGLDIVAVRCDPDFEDESKPSPGGELPFLVQYERYHFDGTRWIHQARQEPGCWDEGDDFPALEKFPE